MNVSWSDLNSVPGGRGLFVPVWDDHRDIAEVAIWKNNPNVS
jgi:hypothetical protein